MNADIMNKTIEDLEDIGTVMSVVVDGDLDEEEARAVAKGAYALLHELQRDLIAVTPPGDGEADRSI